MGAGEKTVSGVAGDARWREKEFSLQTTLIFLFCQLGFSVSWGFGRNGRRGRHLGEARILKGREG